MPEQPIFAGKTVFLEYLELYLIYFHEISHTDAKWLCPKCDGAWFFLKKFSGRKCRKYAGKTGFWHFLISFFWFFAQICALAMLKTWQSPIFEKNILSVENAGNHRFADFVWVFSSYFVVFSHKSIISSDTHHQACFDCRKNLFLKPELSKNRRNSQFSPEKQYFLNISSCTWYFFMKFRTLTQNDYVQNVTEPDFFKKNFPAENAGNMPEKPVFWHFLEVLLLVFSDFLHQDVH